MTRNIVCRDVLFDDSAQDVISALGAPGIYRKLTGMLKNMREKRGGQKGYKLFDKTNSKELESVALTEGVQWGIRTPSHPKISKH